MSASTRTIGARVTAAALATAALVIGLAIAPAAAHSRSGHDGEQPDDAHAYVWKDGGLHVRPQGEPHHGELSSRGGAPWRGGDARTQLVWSQFDADFAGSRIMAARGDGSGLRPLTPTTPGTYDLDPRISPDGRLVLFERDGTESVEVVVIGIDGHGERIIDLGCVDPCELDIVPTWGADGRTIWFTRVMGPFDEASNAASAVLWTADLWGRHVRRVTPAGGDGVYEEYAAKFLPSGDRVFIRVANAATLGDPISSALVRVDRRGREFTLTDYAIGADTLDVSQATRGASAGLVVFETYGHGAPAGVASAVATVPSDCRTVTVCMARVRYLTPTVLGETAPAENYNPTFSPDGSRIAYAHAFYGTDADPTFGADIWTMTWDGRDKRQFTTAAEWDYRPDWGVAARR